MQSSDWERQVLQGERFEFGSNWGKYLQKFNKSRLAIAKASIQKLLDMNDLESKTFLDIGCGSGAFSLAARELGAKVYSFDFDPESVECTRELKRKFFPNDSQWTIVHGSVIDPNFMKSLGEFDIVYSWGVLHHTGDMWTALEYASHKVAIGGCIAVALYNDQGSASKRWLSVKKIYNRLPKLLKGIFAILVYIPFELRSFAIHLAKNKPSNYFKYILDYSHESTRGMSWWHDKIDWIGGLPFQVSKPEDVFKYLKNKGFTLSNLKTCGGGLGCNEYVFKR